MVTRRKGPGTHLFEAAKLQEQQAKDAASRMQASKLQSSYQQAFESANVANEQRYQDILSGYQSRYGEALTGLEGLGDQARKDVSTAYGQQRASTNQQLISSGLYSTTVAPAVQAGVTQRETDALGRVNEQLRREKLGYQTRLSEDTLRFQERRTDEGPSESLYVNLLDRIGQA